MNWFDCPEYCVIYRGYTCKLCLRAYVSSFRLSQGPFAPTLLSKTSSHGAALSSGRIPKHACTMLTIQRTNTRARSSPAQSKSVLTTKQRQCSGATDLKCTIRKSMENPGYCVYRFTAQSVNYYHGLANMTLQIDEVE